MSAPKTPEAKIRTLENQLRHARAARDLWRERYWGMKRQRDEVLRRYKYEDEGVETVSGKPRTIRWTNSI